MQAVLVIDSPVVAALVTRVSILVTQGSGSLGY